MFSSIIFPIVLILATVACALVAGLLFAFAIVTMPGIKRLNDGEFIRAFQVMDGVIQNNHPLFMLVWLGSVAALLLAAVLGFGQLDLVGTGILLTAAALYILGVQLPTGLINVPLNNQLQTLNIDKLNSSAQAVARLNFEPRWNQWNRIRTIMATLVTAMLILLLYLL
ncbi:MAG: DUF1772 domain-containing protein [Ardenticatenales bacterium]|nr:DUF1772 domain-containing protein [Ardenticatenales bacterium]